MDEENNFPIESDHKYTSAVNFLREYTRNSKKYSMIYDDNVAYGFSRNICALKKIAILIALLCVSANILFMVLLILGNGYFFENPSILFCLLSMVVSIFFAIFWILYPTEEYVYGRAIRYAKSLLASCDVLN